MFDLSTKLNLFMEMHKVDGVNGKQSITYEFEGVCAVLTPHPTQ